MGKRAFDLLLSSVGVLVLSPLLVTLAALVKMTSRGSVFYRGVRVGRHGKPFRILKFRSMVENAEDLGPPNVSARDPRVTPIGRFLRRSKLDELPQLLSVLAGDMTLVGPRPELPMYVAMYTEEEKKLLELKPGVTDWASLVHRDQYIDFGRGDDPDKVYLEEIRPLKLRLQLYYAAHHGIGMDLRILAYTVMRLLCRNFRLPAEVRHLVEEHRARHDATTENKAFLGHDSGGCP